MARVRVPILGTISKAVIIEADATAGAQIGTDLQLPDGTVPTLAELAVALASEAIAAEQTRSFRQLIDSIAPSQVPVGAVTQHVGSIDHDLLLNFVSGEHFLQSAISIPASQISDFDTEVANNADVAANTAKITNATHTGEVTGSGALSAAPVMISGKALVTAVTGDMVLLWDATDSALKRANVSDFGGGGVTIAQLAARVIGGM